MTKIKFIFLFLYSFLSVPVSVSFFISCFFLLVRVTAFYSTQILPDPSDSGMSSELFVVLPKETLSGLPVSMCVVFTSYTFISGVIYSFCFMSVLFYGYLCCCSVSSYNVHTLSQTVYPSAVEVIILCFLVCQGV